MRRRPMRFLLVVLAIVIVAIFFLINRPATASNFFLDGPHMNEGQLFVIQLRPGDKSIEIKVAGKNAMKVKWEELDLKVEGQYGKKKEFIPVIKTNNIFVIKPKNLDPSALYFHMRMGDQSEEIKIEKP